jgi:hypothetical protein
MNDSECEKIHCDQLCTPTENVVCAAKVGVAWLWAAWAYVVLHGGVAANATFCGLWYLVGSDWIPCSIRNAMSLFLNLTVWPFFILSPIVFFMMIFVLSSRDREWLYLGICDAALFVLHVVAVIVIIST